LPNSLTNILLWYRTSKIDLPIDKVYRQELSFNLQKQEYCILLIFKLILCIFVYYISSDYSNIMEGKTHFAPAERSTPKEILTEFELVGSQKFFQEIFGILTGIGGVIDKNRQIVYANEEFLCFLGISSLEPILGKRHGEVVSCINSTTESGGCGTSAACAYCGAVNAILESQKTGKKSTKETRISTTSDGKQVSLDMKISSTPINLGGEVFYVLILQDISSEKRRLALERIFFSRFTQ
jgi:hypothetical protein